MAGANGTADLEDLDCRLTRRRKPVGGDLANTIMTCTPEDTLAVARALPGAKVMIMRELGNFPMSENPPLFLSYLGPAYLGPVVAEIAGRGDLAALSKPNSQSQRTPGMRFSF